jgi:hypothetical protein
LRLELSISQLSSDWRRNEAGRYTNLQFVHAFLARLMTPCVLALLTLVALFMASAMSFGGLGRSEGAAVSLTTAETWRVGSKDDD